MGRYFKRHCYMLDGDWAFIYSGIAESLDLVVPHAIFLYNLRFIYFME